MVSLEQVATPSNPRQQKRTIVITIIATVILICCIHYYDPYPRSLNPFVYHLKCLQMEESMLKVTMQSPNSANSSSSYASSITDTTDVSQRFPNVIIFGVRKAGTSALMTMLSLHPRISIAKNEITDEVHYFDRIENYIWGVWWYIKKMPCTVPGQITMEKSPSYFHVPTTAARMASTVGDKVKLILIVRDPVKRAVSDYTQRWVRKTIPDKRFEKLAFRSNGEVSKEFHFITTSMYDVHMERWLKYFKRDQMLVVNGDALVENPIPVLQKVERFIGRGCV